MTPEERILNDKRKELRAIIEAPVPVATRPIWPLYSLIVGADTVRLVTSGGVVDSMRCMVVVGNGHGGVGVGLAKHKDAFSATRRALEKAQRDMIHLATHNGCLFHDLLGKKNGVRVLLRANPATGGVLKGAPGIVDVLELAGVKSASAKIFGSHRRSPYVVMQALFDAFNHHQSPEQQAAMRGLRLVRHTVDRVNPRVVYPFMAPGPRFPPANHRFVK
jgi:small subunit ribosomal protein S5